jgi:integrase
LVQAALETGCRYGEFTRLQVTDFNPDSGTIHILSSKSGKPRHAFLTEDGTAFFKDICARRAGDTLMFVHSNGKPWKASQQGRPMDEVNVRAKLSPRITFHGLRHTWASLAVMEESSSRTYCIRCCRALIAILFGNSFMLIVGTGTYLAASYSITCGNLM